MPILLSCTPKRCRQECIVYSILAGPATLWTCYAISNTTPDCPEAAQNPTRTVQCLPLVPQSTPACSDPQEGCLLDLGQHKRVCHGLNRRVVIEITAVIARCNARPGAAHMHWRITMQSRCMNMSCMPACMLFKRQASKALGQSAGWYKALHF